MSQSPRSTSKQSNRQRYQIQKKIDMGGMAEIFLGKAISLGGIERTVAIKRVLPALTKNEQFIGMFLDEARLSMQLTHANIVQVFDVGRSAGTYFIVMEFVDGYNLRRIFQKASEVGFRIPLEIATYMIADVCKGLAHAHEKVDDKGAHLHIVHRDLSPPNILVSSSGEVKITDFGLAKALSHVSQTDPGVVKGKFSYLSPEAAEGKPVDHRADIFAAGICLWELLANRRLFLGKNDMETVDQVRAAEVPKLSALNPDVTSRFERILERALEKDPRKRYTSARDFGDALAQYLFSNNLKVTSYDVAAMLQRLFSESGIAHQSPEERIGSLLQEEILSQSMLGHVGGGDIDGSRPIDAASLNVAVTPRFDLKEFWSNAGMPQPMISGPGHRTATVMAMEAVRSPDELVAMLEGGHLDSRGRTAESGVHIPEVSTEPASGGGSKALTAIAVVVVLALIGAAVWYFFLRT
ncbi:MAG: serine/threonine protein kinase [Deltaproteobacteria bacterium]|nr:serine/threonine protein kinase [Deltaproteobacteria bacterium]